MKRTVRPGLTAVLCWMNTQICFSLPGVWHWAMQLTSDSAGNISTVSELWRDEESVPCRQKWARGEGEREREPSSDESNCCSCCICFHLILDWQHFMLEFCTSAGIDSQLGWAADAHTRGVGGFQSHINLPAVCPTVISCGGTSPDGSGLSPRLLWLLKHCRPSANTSSHWVHWAVFTSVGVIPQLS